MRELYVGSFSSGSGRLVGVAFSVMPWGGMAPAYGISGALEVDMGFSEGQISASTTVPPLAASAGCGSSGWLGDRIGAKLVLAVAYVLTTLPTLLLGYLITAYGIDGVSCGAYLACAFVYRIAFGLALGAVGAVSMTTPNAAVGATQFTGYMSLRNVSIAYSGYWQGFAASRTGFGATLFLNGFISLTPIVLLPILKPSTTRAVRTATVKR